MTELIKSALRRLLPWSCQRLIHRWRAARYLRTLPPRDPNRKTVIVFNHFFDQDVRALNLVDHDYNLISVDSAVLFRGARIYFDEAVRELKAAYSSADPTRVTLYREECRTILAGLQKRCGVDLVVATSDVFYWIREFIVVAAEKGVKTVVLDKEGTRSTYAFDAEAERLKKFAPFMSEHIFVWSERQRQFWQRIGAEANRITIIGQPRSDLLFNERRREVDRLFPKAQPLITLFSYMDDAYIPVPLIEAEQLNWVKMKTETHQEFYRLAKENSDYNFAIKAHPQQLDLAELKRKYRLDNLRVIGGSAVSNELLQRSELIVAFQTTAIIEAMLLGKRVIYTCWDDSVDRLENDLLPFHRAEGIKVVRSFDEFRQIGERFFAGDQSDFDFSSEQLAARDLFVNTYLHQPDGHVCERFFSMIGPFIR